MTYPLFKKYFTIAVAVFMGLLHIANYTVLSMPSIQFYVWHLLLGMIMIFLYYPAVKNQTKTTLILDWFCIILNIIAGLYLIIDFDSKIELIQTNRFTPSLYVMGFITAVLVLEAARRAVGAVLPLIASIAVIYALIGGYMPGMIGHRGYSLKRVLSTVFSDQGIYGTPIGVSASNVFLFILFAAFLKASGADVIFQDIAMSIAGRKRGGPAKISIIASGFFGSISGSAVANVVSTGVFTISLMKRSGFQARFAGAVEAVASTGGQIMPPIMGAAAFILADLTGIPYAAVCMAALLPALMYYATLYKMVDLEAVKQNIGALPAGELPPVKKSVKKGTKLFIPVFVLLFLLLGLKYTPMRAAIWSIFAIIAFGLINRREPMTFKEIIDGFVGGAKGITQVVAACASSGIVVGMLSLTGLGLKFSEFIIGFGQNNLLLSLILAMFVAMILGMGLPTVAAYIISATALAPALVEIGVPVLAAHLFLLYFASISAITPPVSVASYAAAGIAGEDSIKVSFTAVKLGIAAFLLPYAFAINQHYIEFGLNITTLITWISALVVCYSAAIAVQGYVEQKITIPERILYLTAGILAFQSGLLPSAAGGALFCLLYFSRKIIAKRSKINTASTIEFN